MRLGDSMDNPQPAVLLPLEARKRLIDEAESIKRCYKSQKGRDDALALVLTKLRAEYPEAFRG